MRYKKIIRSIGIFLVQLMGWGMFIVFAPLMVCLTSGNISDARLLFSILAGTLEPCMTLYFINYYILIPHFFFRSKIKKVCFFIINLLIWGGLCTVILLRGVLPVPAEMPEWIWIGVSAGVITTMVLGIGSIGLAIAIRSSQRTRNMKMQLNEERRRRSDAELVWLKNQLNPHFLFNSLNNISSLICIDRDKAQDSIANLSDLLRYALYESDKKYVPIAKEIGFMSNYVELMSLRCGDSTQIEYCFDYENEEMKIAPLLLISLVENAFKHGASTSKSSFVRFVMKESGGELTFVSENSNNPKPDTDRSGKGIGLENTRRRLDLIYGKDYEWCQSVGENSFRSEIRINLLNRQK